MTKLVVHSFTMSDCEDPEIYAAEPVWQWQQTDAGRWIMENSRPDPQWTVSLDHRTYGYRVHITANLEPDLATYWALKWGNTSKN